MRRSLVILGVLMSGCLGLVGEMDDDAGAEVDAGLDAGTAADDAGRDASVDAGLEPDAGTLDDAGASDDAGLPDAGSPDAGPADAGTLVFVIGGQDMRHLVSFDGVHWLNDSYLAPTGLDNAFTGVAVGKGGIILSGDPGIYRSTDGLNFVEVQPRPTGSSLHSSVALFAADTFVVLAGNRGWRSADGITWEYQVDTAGNSGHWHALAYGNGRWIGVGDGKYKVSDDGLTWHDVTAISSNEFQDVAFGNGTFVAVGKVNDAGWVATSTDALTWHQQAELPTPYATGLSSVGFGDGVFLTSSCCKTYSSPDGVTWTERASNGLGGSIVFGGGLFVSAGWRTEARVLEPDAGTSRSTFTGSMPNLYDDAGLAPWFTGIGAGTL